MVPSAWSATPSPSSFHVCSPSGLVSGLPLGLAELQGGPEPQGPQPSLPWLPASCALCPPATPAALTPRLIPLLSSGRPLVQLLQEACLACPGPARLGHSLQAPCSAPGPGAPTARPPLPLQVYQASQAQGVLGCPPLSLPRRSLEPKACRAPAQLPTGPTLQTQGRSTQNGSGWGTPRAESNEGQGALRQ